MRAVPWPLHASMGATMGKLTNKDWWLGRTDDQKQRRADAVQGMKQAGQDMRDATERAKGQARGVNAASTERADANRAAGAERRAELSDEWVEKKAELKADREDRGLGGWGRKKS